MPRILVIDDDARIRELLIEYLSGRGHTVSTASDGDAGLLAARGDVDLVVLDLMMPEMDGFEVVHALNADPTFNIPIVVLTAKQVDQADLARLEMGSRSILSKGRDLKLVLSRMTDLLTN